MGLVFRDDGLVVKQTFITQAMQTHTGRTVTGGALRSEHRTGARPKDTLRTGGLGRDAENRGPRQPGGPGSLQAGNKGQCGGRGPEEAGLDGRRPPQGGKATRGATGEVQQSHRMKRATRGEPRVRPSKATG